MLLPTPRPAFPFELGRMNLDACESGLRILVPTRGTIKVLEAIKELLDNIRDLISKNTEQDEVPLNEELELQSLCADLELDLGDSSSEETELQGAHNSLVTKISQLFDISIIIRQPSHHDRLIGTEKVDGKPFEFHFKQHMSHKYSEAEQPLVDRIGSAMAKQKAILNATIKLSETVATSFHGEKIHGSISDDLISESGLSFTSYAGSLLTGHKKLGIPSMPKEGTAQKPLECPYCFFIITIKDRRAWARHIFRDLSPYICIFPDCSMESKLYDSRKSWHRHVQDKHLSAEGTIGSYECPLCKESSLPSKSFEKHVGRHLEELSLFVLPRTAEEEDVNVDKDKDEHESQSHSESAPEPLCETSQQETSLQPDELVFTPTMTVVDPSYTTDQAIEIPEGLVARQREEDKARLQQLEKDERLGAERRKTVRRYKLQKLEAEQRAREDEAAEKDGDKRQLQHEKLIDLQRQLDEEAEREQIKEEIRELEAEMALDMHQKKMKEVKQTQIQAAALEEWKLAEERRRIAEREKEERAEVHRKHLLPDTLIAYHLPWAWDEEDGNYFIIKKWISPELQDELFAHTRQLRESKLKTYTAAELASEHLLERFERWEKDISKVPLHVRPSSNNAVYTTRDDVVTNVT
ncbi:uncharacterized protein BDV14DRAFT_202974 [Aspergillus stella-maris]|uniref:uncharacterized protein n=1 Tax=Aspergillus stella-maris TaxID=1810926 RepID=UPI003CCDBCF2